MLLMATDAVAQDYEILRLKNGTEITGTIERLPDGSVRITDINGDIFVFSADEIALITNEQLKIKEEKLENRKQRKENRKYSGYSGIVEASVGYSLNGGFESSVGMINCYKVSPAFYIGAGIDVRTSVVYTEYTRYYYTEYGSYSRTSYDFIQSFALPIYFHFRYSILGTRPNNAISPFIACNVGYDVIGPLGILMEPYIGVELKTFKKGGLWMALDLPFYLLGDGFMDICLKVGWSF